MKQNNFWDDVEDFAEDAEEDIEDAWTKFKKSGIKFIFAGFIILIFLMSLVAYYIVPLDPSPQRIPTIEEVVPENLEYSRINSSIYKEYIIVDSEIKAIADTIISESGCPSGSKTCQAKAMFGFVKQNIDYVSDPLEFEYVKTAKESLVLKSGDCDDASVLLSTLLQAIGIKTRLVFVPGHVYVQAEIPDARAKYKETENWISMDATCQYCEFGEISYSSSNQQKHYS